MSLDKLEQNTARWTVKSENDWVLEKLASDFAERAGVNFASLTKETLNISVDKDTAPANTAQDINDSLAKIDGKYKTEVIARYLPELDA